MHSDVRVAAFLQALAIVGICGGIAAFVVGVNPFVTTHFATRPRHPDDLISLRSTADTELTYTRHDNDTPMQRTLRRHVPLITTLLTVVSLVVVIAAVRQLVPEVVLPPLPDSVLHGIPHANAAISALAIGTIGYGWRSIRDGKIERHRQAMGASFLLFLAFLGLYLLRVAIEGPTTFDGPEALKLWVYYPVLGIHMLFAIVCLPLVYYVLLLAATHAPSELGGTAHPRVGRVAASLWLVTFALGIVVYLLLYVLPV